MKGFCVYITYQDSKRKIFLEQDKDFKDFIESIKSEFKIHQENIQLFEVQSKAEITSIAVLEPYADLFIQIGLVSEQSKSVLKICLNDLVNKKFKEADLNSVINEWAVQYGFKLVYKEGLKTTKTGFKREMRCQVKNCGFKLTFKSDKIGRDYELDFKLSIKHNEHKGDYYLYIFLILDHNLDYEEADKFTNEIEHEISMLKGKMKTINGLTKHINKKFKCHFPVHRIQYKVNKLLQETFGKPEEDVNRFVEIALTDVKNNGGFFYFETNQQGQFSKSLYVSKTMEIYSKKFLDVVIIDSTYKRNRFNLPIVNILGVNNLGQNILLGFALLTNETKESYDWIFKKLKLIWKKDPINVICDECQAINSSMTHFID